MSSDTTTIRIRKSTLEMLDELKRRRKARSYDELIRKLIRDLKERELELHFGVDRGKLSEFTEEDRGDARV
ncbi:MAG: ribbon-helix-helix protein, CopG family [Candidatus Korarchaeota archaeon]|nr:ribbon-helix-helix protein, CopG family [Candidatus Korarchaeota archaeon]